MSSDINKQCHFANCILHGYTELGRFSMNLSDRPSYGYQRVNPFKPIFDLHVAGFPKLSQKSEHALNRGTLGGPQATASGCRRHKRFRDQLRKISKTVIVSGPSSPNLLSLRDPDEVSSGPPTGTSWHDLRSILNLETVSESLPHKNCLPPRESVAILESRGMRQQFAFGRLPPQPRMGMVNCRCKTASSHAASHLTAIGSAS